MNEFEAQMQALSVFQEDGDIFLGGLRMRAYEKDTGVKIPAWYLKLPQRVIDFISDMGIILNRLLTRRREIKRTNKRNVKFYL